MIIERLWQWLVDQLRPSWVTLLIMACMISALLYSLDAAKWVNDDTPLVTGFLLGIGLGWMLARSRFSGWFAALYTLVTAPLIVIQGLGHIVPPLETGLNQSFSSLVEGMNLRTVTLYLRALGWLDTLHSGKNIEDNGLFVLALGTVLVVCAVWLMWSVIRRRQVLLGLLPVGLLLALNVHLSGQSLTYYMVFLFCGLLLIVRESFICQHEDWQRRRVDYPDQLGLEWAGAGMALAMAIILLARLAPLVGTPQGWRILSEWTNRTRQTTADTAARLFSGVNPPPTPYTLDLTVYVNTPNMSQIGAPIAQGSKTVMWVKTSDPPPPPPAIADNIHAAPAARVHYWRSGIYGKYTGRGWEPAPLADQAEGPEHISALSPTPGHYLLSQAYQLEARTSGSLFSVNDPLQVTQGVSLHTVRAGGSLLTGQPANYEVISQAVQVTGSELAAAAPDYPGEIRQVYLQLAPALPQRVGLLARRVVAGSSDSYHQALAIQTYLRQNYAYNANVPLPPNQEDVVDYFLFEAPGGFCSHYASAMAVMLRTIGVPARVVTGYTMGEYDAQKQAYRVPESAAHAWVEVFFTGYGWVEFDPTAGRGPIIYPETGAQAAAVPTGAALSSPLGSEPVNRPSPYILIGGVVLALLALPVWLLYTFTGAGGEPQARIDGLYHRIRRTLAWAGVSAPPSQTPDEFLSNCTDRLRPYRQLSQAVWQATLLYRETVYSPRLPDEQHLRAANRLWRYSFSDWLALWLKFRWARLRDRH